MYFYPEGDLFDPLFVRGGDWGAGHDSNSQDVPADLMPSRQALGSCADFARRGYRLVAACACRWHGEITLSDYQAGSPADLLRDYPCPRCGDDGLRLAELRPPADIEGDALEMIPDDAYDADPVYPDDV